MAAEEQWERLDAVPGSTCPDVPAHGQMYRDPKTDEVLCVLCRIRQGIEAEAGGRA